MGARRNATATTAGILRPKEFARGVDLVRRTPCLELNPWVENHWRLAWDLPDRAAFPSQVLTHPTSNLTIERGTPRTGVGDERVLLTGVTTARFDVEASGRGWVWGVRFRPGGLAALTGSRVADLTDRSVAAATCLPGDVVAGLEGVAADTPDDEAQERVEAALRLLRPDPDPAYDDVLAVVAIMLADRDLVRVDQVESRCGISRRRLERLFARYVGVGPKWVLARYRMHDVMSALDEGYDGPLADLAATYGWYDQAHFARDFGAVVGVTPSDYRSRSTR